jgi:hypothetical protein
MHGMAILEVKWVEVGEDVLLDCLVLIREF